MQREHYRYMDGSVACEGIVVRNPKAATPAPVVMVLHAWGGRSAFEEEKAAYLASLGYIGFAVDVYGGGRTGSTKEENSALMTPFMQDRAMLRTRLLAAASAASRIQGGASTSIAAIGFCFGGLCALDLARANAPHVRGVASFHGLFAPPAIGPQAPISAKVLALHGYDDPMATPDQMVSFAAEMSGAKANWEVCAYGGTMHAFTNPQANDPSFGTMFSPQANARSFSRLEDFLAEVFAR